MSTTPQALPDLDAKIGDTRHPGRTLWVTLVVLGAASVMTAYYVHEHRVDAPKLAALAEFRQAYADKCEVAEFRGPTPSYVADDYLNREDLQRLIAHERGALASESCKDIDQHLRTAGFPLTSARP